MAAPPALVPKRQAESRHPAPAAAAVSGQESGGAEKSWAALVKPRWGGASQPATASESFPRLGAADDAGGRRKIYIRNAGGAAGGAGATAGGARDGGARDGGAAASAAAPPGGAFPALGAGLVCCPPAARPFVLLREAGSFACQVRRAQQLCRRRLPAGRAAAQAWRARRREARPVRRRPRLRRLRWRRQPWRRRVAGAGRAGFCQWREGASPRARAARRRWRV